MPVAINEKFAKSLKQGSASPRSTLDILPKESDSATITPRVTHGDRTLKSEAPGEKSSAIGADTEQQTEHTRVRAFGSVKIREEVPGRQSVNRSDNYD